MHTLKNKRNVRKGLFGFKLNMSKVDDRVKWDFTEGMMLSLSFDVKLVGLIRNCISSISYLVYVNGEAIDSFRLSRGLRQGCPFSPYLFLICMEGFSTLLKLLKQDGHMLGVNAYRGSPSMMHIFFVDDII